MSSTAVLTIPASATPGTLKIPPDSLDFPASQHMNALLTANTTRVIQAACRQDIAFGRRSVPEVLEKLENTPELASMTIADLLEAQRLWGDTRVRKFLAKLPMSTEKTIGSMTERQRLVLVDALRGASTSRTPRSRPAATATPRRSPEQRFDALARANLIRKQRAVLKREMKQGRRLPLTVLENPPFYAESMRMQDFLLAVPRVGKVKCKKALSLCRIAPRRTVAALTSRQRQELAEYMGWC